MKRWVSVIILALSIILTWLSQECAYWFEPYFQPVYTLTLINVFAGVGYIIAIVIAVIMAIRLKTAQMFIILIGVLLIGLAMSWMNLFITAMWWG